MIPVYQPEITEIEKKYVQKCLDSSWISSKGEFVSRFENDFASYISSKYASTVSNGTVALHLALICLGIKEGDEVLVPALTYIASGNAIKYCGALPRVVDVCEKTWQMDPSDIARKLSPKTKAIMPVHLYGFSCDMDPICALAKAHNLFIIEDCAEAFGTYYKGRHVGTFGDVATFSFFGNKTITCGEGGMIVTNNSTIHEQIGHLKSQGLAKNQEYVHDALGYNYRLTNVQSAIGCAQLERADSILKAKRELAWRYKNALSHLPLIFPPDDPNCINSFWMCSFLAESREQRDFIRKRLKERNIETRPFFTPLHLMSFYDGEEGDCPVSESLSMRGLNLPSWPGLSEEQIALICSTIEDCFTQAGLFA